MINVTVEMPDTNLVRDIRVPLHATVNQIVDILADVYDIVKPKNPVLISRLTGNELYGFDQLDENKISNGDHVVLRG